MSTPVATEPGEAARQHAAGEKLAELLLDWIKLRRAGAVHPITVCGGSAGRLLDAAAGRYERQTTRHTLGKIPLRHGSLDRTPSTS